jgi:hypothetical protein
MHNPVGFSNYKKAVVYERKKVANQYTPRRRVPLGKLSRFSAINTQQEPYIQSPRHRNSIYPSKPTDQFITVTGIHSSFFVA